MFVLSSCHFCLRLTSGVLLTKVRRDRGAVYPISSVSVLPTTLDELLPGEPSPTQLDPSSYLLGACHRMTLVSLELRLPVSADPRPLEAQLSGSPRLAVSLALRVHNSRPSSPSRVIVNKEHRPPHAQSPLADVLTRSSRTRTSLTSVQALRCHRYAQSAMRQGTLAWGRTRALQRVSSTSLSWPWSSCMQATICVAVPRPQLAEHGPRDRTFHLQGEKVPVTAMRASVCGTIERPSASAAVNGLHRLYPWVSTDLTELQCCPSCLCH